MKNKVYEQAVSEVQDYIDKFPSTRADRFKILSAITGIDEGTARVADRYLRAIRQVIEPDKICKAKEQEWKRSPALCNWFSETEKKYRQQNLI